MTLIQQLQALEAAVSAQDAAMAAAVQQQNYFRDQLIQFSAHNAIVLAANAKYIDALKAQITGLGATPVAQP